MDVAQVSFVLRTRVIGAVSARATREAKTVVARFRGHTDAGFFLATEYLCYPRVVRRVAAHVATVRVGGTLMGCRTLWCATLLDGRDACARDVVKTSTKTSSVSARRGAIERAVGGAGIAVTKVLARRLSEGATELTTDNSTPRTRRLPL